MKRTRYLANWLTTTFTLAVILPLVIAGLIFGWVFISFSDQSIQTRQGNIIEMGQAYVNRYFSDLLEELSLIAGLTDSTDLTWVGTAELICQNSNERYLSLFILDEGGNEIAHLEGCRSVGADEQINRSSEEAFFRAARGELFIGNISFNEENQPIATISFSMTAQKSQEVVIIGRVDLGNIWEPLNDLDIGEGGYIYVVDRRGNLVGYRDPEFTRQAQNLAALPSVAPLLVNQPGVNALTYRGLTGVDVIGSSIVIESIGWGLILEQPVSEILTTRNQLGLLTLAVLLAFSVVAILVALYIARSIVTPIQRLAAGAEAIAREDFSVVVDVGTQDEIGLTANAFNQMTARLRDLIGTLEQRVADRTRALATVAEISTSASTSLETDKLLQQVVDLAKERFELYHAHIYLLDDTESSLVLTSGAGDAGKQMVATGHSIPLDREQSLVARAAREGKGVTVNDVTTAPDFLPNPLLPNARSELAVPMMAGKDVIGVFDVQSDIVGRFTESDIAVQTTLASQVASAVQNARSYTELQRNQSLLSEALNVSRLANWEYDVEQDLFHFNDHFYSIFRTTVENVGGYNISSADYARIFVHPEDAPLVGAEIQKVLESKERHFKTELEHRIIFSDGEVGYISVKINVDRDENGKILRWYGANQDVTERRQLEEQNRKRANQQEMISTITQRIQNAATIESALQIATRELGHALGNKPAMVQLNPKSGEQNLAGDQE